MGTVNELLDHEVTDAPDNITVDDVLGGNGVAPEPERFIITVSGREIDMGELKMNGPFCDAFEEEFGDGLLEYISGEQATTGRIRKAVEFVAWWIDTGGVTHGVDRDREWFRENITMEHIAPFIPFLNRLGNMFEA